MSSRDTSSTGCLRLWLRSWIPSQGCLKPPPPGPPIRPCERQYPTASARCAESESRRRGNRARSRPSTTSTGPRKPRSTPCWRSALSRDPDFSARGRGHDCRHLSGRRRHRQMTVPGRAGRVVVAAGQAGGSVGLHDGVAVASHLHSLISREFRQLPRLVRWGAST